MVLVLKAMGKNDKISEDSIRVSLSNLNTKEEMIKFSKTLKEVLLTIK